MGLKKNLSPLPNRTYSLLTGDSDFYGTVELALKLGLPVEIWSFKKALAGLYADLVVQYRSSQGL